MVCLFQISFLFVTVLAKDAYDTAGIPQNQYKMAALKLRIDRNNRIRPIQVEKFIPFGPLANKDTNVFEIDLNNQTKTEIANIYRFTW